MAPSCNVLIVGAGLAGITLAILLERANVQYSLLESASSEEITSAGGAIVLGPTIMPLLEQLGLLDRVRDISKPIKAMHIIQEDRDLLKRIGEFDLSDHRSRTGYDSLVTTRPELLKLFLSQLPATKVHFRKRVVAVSQNKDKVTVRCADDDSTFRGDLLVGADGAWSTVREQLYRQVSKKGILPRGDAEAAGLISNLRSTPGNSMSNLSSSGSSSDSDSGAAPSRSHHRSLQRQQQHVTMVGVTEPLESESYKEFLQGDESHCDIVIGDRVPHCWSYYAVSEDRICWSVNFHLDEPAFQELRTQSQSRSPPSPTPSATSSTRSSSPFPLSPPSYGWSFEDQKTSAATIEISTQSLQDECRNFKLSIGGSIGDLIKMTPSHSITQARLAEEKLFDTWHHGRTVLIGDACHRMLPKAGQGAEATNGMQDAIILANLIADLPSTELATSQHLVELFKDFQSDRYPHAKALMHIHHKLNRIFTSSPSASNSSNNQDPTATGTSTASSSSPPKSQPHTSWTEYLMRKVMVRYITKVYHHFSDHKILADRPQATFLPLVQSHGSVSALPPKPHKVFGANRPKH
ncbi:hypothetical protein BGW38_006438 [Lunasporangiospora selenospora]|uniref:FAD-binding domain-containing protein n=1 Tax=Lunasporangiospora selenospora TaxID=979761 RepID=A0A9P6FZS9_9FUNG|nr:hypothetical protein BGW38_006438 [Lunasporangiospora selenospora]